MTISEQDILRILMKSRDRIAVAAWVVLRDAHAAEDIFQNVALKALKQEAQVGELLRSNAQARAFIRDVAEQAVTVADVARAEGSHRDALKERQNWMGRRRCRLRVRGHMVSSHDVYFGVTVRYLSGGFAGRFKIIRPATEFSSGKIKTFCKPCYTSGVYIPVVSDQQKHRVRIM